jgi:hypothetical protein
MVISSGDSIQTNVIEFSKYKSFPLDGEWYKAKTPFLKLGWGVKI